MQVNIQKLRRIEERAKQAHAALMDVQTRHSEALYALNQGFGLLTNQVKKYYGEEALNRLNTGWNASNAEACPETERPTMRKLLASREEVDRLKGELEAANSRYQGRVACLEPLRQFTKQAEAVGGF